MPPITVRVIAATKSTVLPNARLIAIAAALSMAAQIPRNRQKKSARIFKKNRRAPSGAWGPYHGGADYPSG